MILRVRIWCLYMFFSACIDNWILFLFGWQSWYKYRHIQSLEGWISCSIYAKENIDIFPLSSRYEKVDSHHETLKWSSESRLENKKKFKLKADHMNVNNYASLRWNIWTKDEWSSFNYYKNALAEQKWSYLEREWRLTTVTCQLL